MDEGVSFKAQQDMQQRVEKLYSQIKLNLKEKTYKNFVILDKEGHSEFCLDGLQALPRGVSSLSSGQPWLLYWILNALNILGSEVSAEIKDQIVLFISECKCQKTGAFAGGPYQLPHLAPTYASIAALISINTTSGYELIDRQGIYNFLLSMKKKDVPGAFSMHENGENDMRSVYCAICVSSILNILDEEISKDVADYVVKCQNYDGGFSAEPFGESHGGYTYCAVASLIMLNKIDSADCEAALE